MSPWATSAEAWMCLPVTEGIKVATEITVSCKVDGQPYEDKRIETLTLWGRNAMTWDDNRKAAAYVTSKDPGVLNFARSVSSSIHGKENRSICDNLFHVVAISGESDMGKAAKELLEKL